MTGTWRWSLVAIAGVGLIAAVAPLLIYWAELPDPIAVRWWVDYRPVSAMPKATWLLTLAGVVGVPLATALVGSARAYAVGRAARVAFVTLASAIAAAISATIVLLNVGRSVWTEAGRLTPDFLALTIVLPLALAAVAWLSALRVWRHVQPPAPAAAPPLPLAAGARAYWTGSAANRWLLAIGGLMLAQAAVFQAALPQLPVLAVLSATFVVAAVALEFFSRIRVTIDHRGVHVRYGHLGLWTRRIPLARIIAAQAVDIDPLAHGGWGYRGSLLLFRRASIVVRAGPALKLDLTRGQQLFITVDDAPTAARLLSALLEREPAAHVAVEVNPG